MAFLKRLFGFKSSVPTSDNFQVFYNCNGCFNAFEVRSNAVDLPENSIIRPLSNHLSHFMYYFTTEKQDN